jgi:hypothetical protein
MVKRYDTAVKSILQITMNQSCRTHNSPTSPFLGSHLHTETLLPWREGGWGGVEGISICRGASDGCIYSCETICICILDIQNSPPFSRREGGKEKTKLFSEISAERLVSGAQISTNERERVAEKYLTVLIGWNCDRNSPLTPAWDVQFGRADASSGLLSWALVSQRADISPWPLGWADDVSLAADISRW